MVIFGTEEITSLFALGKIQQSKIALLIEFTEELLNLNQKDSPKTRRDSFVTFKISSPSLINKSSIFLSTLSTVFRAFFVFLPSTKFMSHQFY